MSIRLYCLSFLFPFRCLDPYIRNRSPFLQFLTPAISLHPHLLQPLFAVSPPLHSLRYSTSATLTHTDSSGKARMVSVTSKPHTHRTATAVSRVILGRV